MPDDGTEFRGVSRQPSGKYIARIWNPLTRTQVHLGTFDTAEDAAKAYDAAADKLPCVKKAVKKGARGTPGSRRGFRGVCRRANGRYVAEMRDTKRKANRWIGTFGTAEEAARAYDAVAVELRGAAAQTNFKIPAAVQFSAGSDGGGGGAASSSSRWPKAEVLALIQLRSNLDMKEGSGALWEGISAGMRRMGYSRSSQRCREKWWNMSKHFKKVKELPEYSRTWPYFHHLEALYRNEAVLRSPSGGGGAAAEHVNEAPEERIEASSGSDGGGRASSSSSRWPKAEVHALIQPRTCLKMRRNGPKAPLLEEISAGMGYSWSSKQCMDRWTKMTIKKVKDIYKTRPDISKTYLHQLEALYRNKAALGSPAGACGTASVHTNAVPQDRIEAAPISQTAMKPHTVPPVAKNGMTRNDDNGHDVGGVSGGTQMQASNGGRVAGNRFVSSEQSSMDLLNDLPELPVRSSTLSNGAEVEEFLMGFTDVVA